MIWKTLDLPCHTSYLALPHFLLCLASLLAWPCLPDALLAVAYKDILQYLSIYIIFYHHFIPYFSVLAGVPTLYYP